MVTVEQATALIGSMLAAGLEMPPALARPGMMDVATADLARQLTRAGLTYADAQEGLDLYLSEADGGQWRKPWPDAGKIVARSRVGRTAAAMGSPADADAAFEHFAQRMRDVGFRPSREIPMRHLDLDDPVRNDALFLTLDRFGGVGAWSCVPDEHANALGYAAARKRWIAHYLVVRGEQGRDPGTVRAALTARPGGHLRLVEKRRE